MLVVTLVGCDGVFGLTELPAPPDRSIRKITITQSTGATLVDFPVSIVTTGDEDLALRARLDGSDIRFTDLDGALLPREVVTYASGALEAWVQVTLESTTEILLVYGNDPPTEPDPADTWSPQFTAVWHLAAVEGERDSTRNAYHVSPSSVGSIPQTAPGIIGRGRGYLETPQQHRLCAPASRTIDMADQSFSFSGWINAPPTVGTYSQPFAAGGHSGGQGGFAFELTDSGALLAFVTDSPPVSFLALPFASRPVNTWTHLVAVVDRPNNRLLTYLDGGVPRERALRDAQGDQLLRVVTEAPICIGGSSGYEGLVDEIRIYNQLVTPEWIRAEIDNVLNRDNFVRIDPPAPQD